MDNSKEVPSITQTMSLLATLGLHVMVLVDPERRHLRFTLNINGRRLKDTDAPDRDLYEYFHQNLAGALKTYVGEG